MGDEFHMFPPPPSWLATCDYNLCAAVAVAGGGRVPRPSRCHCANLMQFLSVSPWAPIDNSSPFGVVAWQRSRRGLQFATGTGGG